MNAQPHLAVHKAESLAFRAPPRLKRAMSLNKTQKTPLDAANTSLDLENLLAKVGAEKDKDAFVSLFNYFAPRVKSYMLKNGASDSTAEEIVQNTFITVWEKAASYNPKKAAASTWIFTVARNKRIDALRRDKNTDVNSENPAIENAVAEAVGENYAEAEDVEKLNAAIATLPPEQSELLRLAFFEEKSHSDISAETKIPLGTVKSRLRLAMEMLKSILNPGGKP